MISLIVPNLNDAVYLRKFLRSLAAQTYQNFELILVDGGSTDESLKIAGSYVGVFPLRIIVDETRNMGYVRNLGSWRANGLILFHTNSDVMLEPRLLEKINDKFYRNTRLICLAGRTKPVSEQLLVHCAYQGFDLIRWFFSRLPGGSRRFRAGGSFLAIRSDAFWYMKGFPEVQINEDGLLGEKIEGLLQAQEFNEDPLKAEFDLSLFVHHHVKRFEQRGSLKTILFYAYVFRNFFPFLDPLLSSVEVASAKVFSSRSDLKEVPGRC